MSIIVIGDVHASNKHIENIKNSFNYLFNTNYYNKANALVFQGDVFDDRKSINVEVLEEMINLFKQMKDKKIFIITGNHDMYNKKNNDISSLNVLENIFSNVEVIKKPVIKNISNINIYMLPFGSDIEKKEVEKADYILGHLEIYPYFPDARIKENDFLGKKVFMGHLHKFDPNTPYSGSLFTTNYGEIDNQKHFLFIEDKEKYTHFKNEADVLHLSMKIIDDKLIIPFLKKEIPIDSISTKDIDNRYKFFLKAKEADIDRLIQTLSENDINIELKVSIIDEEEEVCEVDDIDNINPAELINKKHNNIFKVFEEEIKDDNIKMEILKEIKEN